MSESIAPAVDLETENDIDPGTEMPYQEASAGKIEVTDETDEEEDQNKEETNKQEEETWKKRERDFFARMTLGPEALDDRPLVGRELLRELELHKKMRKQVLEEVKNLRNSPYMKNLMLSLSMDPEFEDLDESLMAVQSAFMPHPFPL